MKFINDQVQNYGNICNTVVRGSVEIFRGSFMDSPLVHTKYGVMVVLVRGPAVTRLIIYQCSTRGHSEHLQAFVA